MQVKILQATFTRWEQLPPSATERIVLSKELLSRCESIELQVRNHVAKVVGILGSMEGWGINIVSTGCCSDVFRVFSVFTGWILICFTG
jgi:hypothetical protein